MSVPDQTASTPLLLPTRPYVAVFPDLVRTLGGMEPAAILQVVAYRQADAGGGPVPILVSDFVESTGLSESTVKRHLKALAERGVLVRERPSRRQAMEYAVERGHPDLTGERSERPPGEVKVTGPGEVRAARSGAPSGVGVTSRPFSSKTKTKTPQPAPPLRDDDRPPVVLALVASGDVDEPALFASSEVAKPETASDGWPPEATANGCRRAWIQAWTEARGAPDPSILKRAVRIITGLARDRKDLDDWRRLWEACRAAGRTGRWNVADLLAPAPARYGTNAHVVLAEQAAHVGMIDQLLSTPPRPALGGPR